MATRDDGVQVAAVSRRDGLALALGLLAAEAAGEAARDGSYTPTDSQWRLVSLVLRRAIEAGVAALSDEEVASIDTPERLGEVARELAWKAVRDVLGPAPRAH